MKVRNLITRVALVLAVTLPMGYGQVWQQNVNAAPVQDSRSLDEQSDKGSEAKKESQDDEIAPILKAAEALALSFAEQELKLGKSEIVSRSMVLLPSEQPIFAFKILDELGMVHDIVLDGQGRSQTREALFDKEDLIYGKSGRIHPSLQDRLSFSRDNDEEIPVLIWIRVPNEVPLPTLPSPDDAYDEKTAEKLQRDFAGVAMIRNKAYADSVLEKLIDDGADAVLAEDAPMIATALTKDQIFDLAADKDVLEIYLDSINEQQSNVARRVVGADIVNNRGITGNGIRVAVIERYGRVNLNNPYLNVAQQQMTYTSLHWHAASVAGVIASRHSTHRGIAPFVQLYVGGSHAGWDSELQQSMTWARTWGARVINNSWGYDDTSRVPNAMARYLDNLVFTHRMTVVNSAGNRGAQTVPNVTNPATAYNIITVGSFDDRNTLLTADDVMSTFSSYLNPTSTSGDRIKPEVVAPGTAIINLTNASPWLHGGVNGTSFSAPAVSGIAALIMQRAPSLQQWPEVVKAIIMATALQNLEGAARLSTRDGAGGVQAHLADDVTRGVNGGWGGTNYNTNAAFTTNLRTISLVAGKRTRVVIAWNNNPNYASYASRPSADVDLQILGPNGQVVIGSYSFDNTYEIVDFVPSVTGNYTIRARKHRMDMTPGYLGYAWYRVP
ncbi:MAG TPA: S8 family peptidase [Pirellulaceae bacterium]|nr:S8 family peptidase [Pirellulaceae bacterium]HMO91374.1 S8 family peptidase [Pirellulaceae bacterium]